MGSTEQFDLIVIGCCPAGEKAGAQAAFDGLGNLAGHRLREG